jgi:WXG100 family type VII secretion target
MPMAEFRINYEKVVEQANEMSDLARDLGDRIAAMEDLLSRVKSEWHGPASEAYQNQLIMLIADMKTTKYNMSSVSTTIKNVADRIQREDERLAEQAEAVLLT